MFIELEDLNGIAIFIDPHKISCIQPSSRGTFCVVYGREYEVNHTPEEIIKTIRQALAHEWELNNV